MNLLTKIPAYFYLHITQNLKVLVTYPPLLSELKGEQK